MPTQCSSSADDGVITSPLGPDKDIPSTAFAVTLFDGLKRHRPSATALVDVTDGKSLTFGKFHANVETAARHLLRLGCRHGDVIAIFSPNSFQWMMVAAAGLRIGAVFAAINHLLKPGELKQQLRLCGAKFLYTVRELASIAFEVVQTTGVQTVIVNEELTSISTGGVRTMSWNELQTDSDRLPSLPATTDLGVTGDDPVMIFFSSGTTGPQKAVMLSHRNIHAQFVISCDARVKKVRPNELMFAPFAHIKGSLFTLYDLVVGYTTHILPRFNLNAYLRHICDNKIDSLSVVPAIAIQLAKSPEVARYDLSCIREIVCGTAPLHHKLETLLRQRFPGLILRQAYGLTETASIVTNVPTGLTAEQCRAKSGSVGVPLYNVQLKMVDPATGKVLGTRENGEIWIKSPLVMIGYAGNPAATAATIDEDGWLHTGDIGYYDDDRFVYIVGRIKELIKYKSYQVAPTELEALLLGHPEVADAAVVGVPDAEAGELPMAFVVRRDASSISEDQLQTFVAERVAGYKRLRGGVRFVKELPRSPSGKLLRPQMIATLLSNNRL